MDLETYRLEKNLSYEELSELLGLSYNKTWRIAQDSGYIKLIDAQRIIKATDGEVTIKDLLQPKKYTKDHQEEIEATQLQQKVNI